MDAMEQSLRNWLKYVSIARYQIKLNCWGYFIVKKALQEQESEFLCRVLTDETVCYVRVLPGWQ